MSVLIGSRKDRTVSGAIAALDGKPTTLTTGTAIGILVEAAAASPGSQAGKRATTALTKALTGHEEPQVRVAAAKALGRIDAPAAVRALRRVADDEVDGQLVAAASEGLARLGTRADTRRLTGAADRATWEHAVTAAGVSTRLLAHRLGLRLDPADVALRLPGEDAPTLPVTGRIKARIHDVELPVPRKAAVPDPQWAALVPSDAAPVGAFDCGGRTHVVLATGDPARLREAPGVAGALLGTNESMGTTYVRWVVLTRPEGDGVAVTLARPTGEVGFVGTGSWGDDGSLTVTVEAVDAPGATAARATATLRGRTFTIDGRAERALTVPRLVPAAFAPR
jgi:hypothetical protein